MVETSLDSVGRSGPLSVNALLSSTVAEYGGTEVRVYALYDGSRGYTIRTYSNSNSEEHRCVINY